MTPVSYRQGQSGTPKQKFLFGCHAGSEKDASRALLLVESIRTFAGEYSNLPFLLMLPAGQDQLTEEQQAQINRLEVSLHSFELDPAAAKFPFAGKVVASAAAESLSAGNASQLVWMDNGTLVVNPLDDLVLYPAFRLGYRPVDHLLIGSPYEKPIDLFWSYIFEFCGVSEEDVYPMVTSTDQVKMRPYINAGMLVVRPEDNLLQRWRDTFMAIYQDRQMLDFYQMNQLYEIFIHQAVLAGCIMTGYQQQEIFELPHLVNYALHMHNQYPAYLQPSAMNQLVSLRYESFFSKSGWPNILQVEHPLKKWLEERIDYLSAL